MTDTGHLLDDQADDEPWTPSELWEAVAVALRTQVTDATWRAWFESIEPIEGPPDRLVLSVPSAIVKERIESRYLELVNDAISEAIGEHRDVALVVDESASAELDEAIAARVEEGEPAGLAYSGRATPPGAVDQTPLNSRYTFDAFVIGHSNRFAHAAAMAVAETPGKTYNPLFIHGGSGLGKTHLQQAIGNYVRDNFPGRRVRYISTETYMNEFIDAIRTSSQGRFKRKYREDLEVLLLDDVQFIERSEQLQEEFFHNFNSLYNSSKQIVLTCDRPAGSLATLEERLKSRFVSGLTTDVQPPELETRLAILRKKAEGESEQVPDDVLEFIASHITDNIRELEGAFIRVTAFASLNHQPLTLEVAEGVLADMVNSSAPRQITPALILDMTSETFGYAVDELRGPNRRRPLVLARQIGMYVFREITDYSYPAIAREFGGRDHTTVIHAVDKITGLMKERRQIYDQVTSLITRIKSGA